MDALGTLNAALSGRYEILSEIGAGGMATVYLARDVKHDRRVALKVLKPELGAVLGVERFLTEIRVTANLQHPNILPLFDSGEADGLLFYVMPFVDGESLRSRLEREKQLPVDESIRIAIAVAGALDYAHSHDVIHRDLKPDNILMQAGQPVIADFGIALAVTKAGGARITQSGLSLGTPLYMSPEQATADRQIDGRTDIYSLGTVLYEMLTGDPPYTASTAQAVIAKVIIGHAASVRVSRAAVPQHVAAALDKALEKLPADRWPTAGAFAEALRGAQASPQSPVSPALHPTAIMAGVDRRRRVLRTIPWVVAVVAIAVAAWSTRRPHGPFNGEPLWFTVSVPNHLTPPIFTAIAPDGRQLAFVTTDPSGRSLLHVRSLTSLEARPIVGTEDAAHPFWSPDSKWIGFLAFGKLKKVAVGGGPVETLAERTFRYGGTWSQQDTILFVTDADGAAAKVSAGGGTVLPVMVRDSSGHPLSVTWPRFMPDGRHFLFYGGLSGPSHGVYVSSLDSPDAKFLLTSDYRAVYAPQGYLLFMRDDRSLMAQPFDARHLELTGTAAPVAGNVYGVHGAAHTNVSVSSNGVLAYVDQSATNSELAWFDRQGGRHGAAAPAGDFSGTSKLSPDGKLLLVTQGAVFNREDIWVYSIGPGRPARRLTFDAANANPLWSRDGRQIVFESRREGHVKVYRMPANGGGTSDLLFDAEFGNAATASSIALQDMSPDGRYLVFSVTPKGKRQDLWVVPLGDTGKPFTFVKGEYDDGQAAMSPDGHWLAYTSNETGRSEVYVQSFPRAGHKRAISVEGGVQPRWRRDGKELFYLAANQQLMAVPVRLGTEVEVGSAAVLFRADMPNWGAGQPGWKTVYDASADGSRFVLLTAPEGDVPPIVIVVNWPAVLKR